jgi:hypothetical protein
MALIKNGEEIFYRDENDILHKACSYIDEETEEVTTVDEIVPES